VFKTYYEKYMMLVGVLGQSVFYVQAFHIFHHESASDVSFLAFSLGLISVASWFIYGVLLKNSVLIIANAVAIVGASSVLIAILMYG
jgi:MtN3 and saliva related transmembrane protein